MFAGLIIVHFFTETMNAGTRSIVRNKPLVQKMAVPREMFPVASMLVSLFHAGAAGGDPAGRDLPLGLESRPVGHRSSGCSRLLISMVLGTALALFFSAANVFLRDFSNAVSVLSNFMRFGVPMMYPYTLVAHEVPRPHRASTSPTRSPRPCCFQRAFWVGAHQPSGAHHRPVDMPPHLSGFSRGPADQPGAPGVRPVGRSPAWSDASRAAPVSTTRRSIVVRHVSKKFTLRYHRTLKQMSVAMLRQQRPLRTRSWPSTTSPSPSSRVSRSG